MTDILDQTVNGGLCHGCGACAAALGEQKLKMRMTAAGYLRPHQQQPLSSEDRRNFAEVCSGRNVEQVSDGRYHDRTWGPYLTIETGYSTDDEVRFKGSSGGTITSIVMHLLETKAVDFVVQTHADPADPVGNATSASYTRNDVLSAAGSRYAPSAPLEEIEHHLATGGRFAFVGKPCDVVALRMMAKRDYRIREQVPFMISFFCAGVPSRVGALAVLEKLAVQESELASFSYRGDGWPGMTRATLHDGTTRTMDYHSSWGTLLSRHLQFRCKICPEGVGEFADITCADAWYGKNGYPDFAEREGRSLVIARTRRGRALLDAMSAEKKVALKPLKTSEIRLMQPYQFDRRRAVLVRLAAMLLRGKRIPTFRGLHLAACMLRSSPVWLAKNFLGTFRRIPRRSPLK